MRFALLCTAQESTVYLVQGSSVFDLDLFICQEWKTVLRH